MIDPESSSRVALISGLLSLAGTVFVVLAPILSKRRSLARRTAIHDSEGIYQRLERENTRLTDQFTHERTRSASLETALAIERDLHRQTRELCDRCEAALRRLGHFPPPAIDAPDENGGSR